MADKPQLNMEIQPDRSALFHAHDDVEIRVVFDSPTQVKIEMWRERDNVYQGVPPDVGNIGKESFREKLAQSARDAFNPPANTEGAKAKDTVPNILEDLGHVATALGIPSISELLKPESGVTIVDRLVEIIEESGTLFTNPSGRAYASVEEAGHAETYDLDTEAFEDFLKGRFYITERQRLEEEAKANAETLVDQLGGMVPPGLVRVKRPPVVKQQAVNDAISQLKSVAKVSKNVERVWLRVGGHEGRFYIDLCNDEWEAVEVDDKGWRVVKNPPVRFVRADGMLPLPHPEKGGSLEELKELLNIRDTSEDPDSKRNWTLMLAWLVQALRPDPQHPILALKGGEGTAKSFTAYLLRFLVDPHDSPDDYTPPDLRTFCIWAEHEWVVALDNISSMPEWLSNAMCKMVTGMGFKVRTLYSDRGLQIFKARRPITINSIANIGTNRDLLSRSLILNLPVITKYELEREVLDKFEERRPKILGCLLDAICDGLRKLPTLKVEGRGTRMPDFDLWGRATEEALGLNPGDFLEARGQGEREAIQDALEAEPVAITIEKFAYNYSESEPYRGEAKDLLKELNRIETDEQRKRHKSWPKIESILGQKLSKLQSSLRVEGVHVEKMDKGAKGKRGWVVFYRAPEGVEDAEGGRPEDTTEESATQAATPEDAIDKPQADEGGRGGSDETFPEDSEGWEI